MSAVAIGIIVGAFMILPAGIAIAVLSLIVAGLGWTLVALAQNFIGVK